MTFSLSGEVTEYDVKAQTHSVIENIETILKDSGLNLKNLVDVQVFLTNMKNDFKDFNSCLCRVF